MLPSPSQPCHLLHAPLCHKSGKPTDSGLWAATCIHNSVASQCSLAAASCIEPCAVQPLQRFSLGVCLLLRARLRFAAGPLCSAQSSSLPLHPPLVASELSAASCPPQGSSVLPAGQLHSPDAVTLTLSRSRRLGISGLCASYTAVNLHLTSTCKQRLAETPSGVHQSGLGACSSALRGWS